MFHRGRAAPIKPYHQELAKQAIQKAVMIDPGIYSSLLLHRSLKERLDFCYPEGMELMRNRHQRVQGSGGSQGT
jgi:hypothetical protein